MGKNNLTIDDLIRFAYLSDVAYKDELKVGRKVTNAYPQNAVPFELKDIKIVNNDLAILNDTETGAYAFLAEDGQGNKYIVFRGTEGKRNIKDLANDLEILMGKAPEQLKVAQRWINDLKDRGLISESDNVYAVGHSLGGYLAN